MKTDANGIVALAYSIELDGELYNADARHIRKKKPPRRDIDQVTTWDKCAWQPREMEHA